MRKRVVLVALVVGVFAVGLTVVDFGPQEPMVGGMRLRRWVEQTGFSGMNKGLAKVGPQAIPWLIKGLEAKESGIEKVKVWVWRKLSPGLQQKWRRFGPIHARTLRANCAFALQEFGPEAVAAVPKLIRMAESDDIFGQQVARSALGAMAPRSPEAMAALMRWLRDGDSVLRSQVTGAFYAFELAPKEALPLLLAQLEHYEQGKSTSDKPLNEMLAISVYGPEAAPAGPLLVKYVTRGEGRGNALNALRAAGPGALPALPRLLQLLEERAQPGEASRTQMKPGIFSVIRKMGPGAEAALPALTNALSDANGVVRALAAAGIGNITGDYGFAVLLLVKELENRNFGNDDVSFSLHGRHLSLGLNQRQLASKLLGEMGLAATNALPNLTRALKSGDMWLPAFAAEAIWRISGDADAILPSLIASLSHSDESRRLLTLRVLTAMGPRAKSAMPAIRTAMDREMSVRREAFEALEAVQRGGN